VKRLWGFFLLGPALLWAQPPTSLDEVFCATCHFDQGEEFGQSIHYQEGQLLCHDCHGGLPFEADPEKAKGPGSGFIGRPGREQIAALCGKCHAAPAHAFAQGPHAAWQNAANPTCISCHTNHHVLDASLELIDTTCGHCHQPGTPALARGEAIRQQLGEANQQHRRLQLHTDSLLQVDGSLRRAVSYLEAGAAALREADPMTHALDLDLLAGKLDEARAEQDQVKQLLAEREVGRQRRSWAVGAIWVLVAANVFLLWRKRRQLQ